MYSVFQLNHIFKNVPTNLHGHKLQHIVNKRSGPHTCSALNICVVIVSKIH